MKDLILFDVDGTLTNPRIKIERSMIDVLIQLSKVKNLDIGIVGGSDIGKQKEQIGCDNLKLFDWIFSENGLMAFHKNQQFHCENITNKLGEESFTELINICLSCLSDIDNPIKRGNFIETRNGMINISPIGRSCSQKEREAFNKQDDKYKYRERLIKQIKRRWDNYLYINEGCDTKLNFSIGGQISIDIFPEGWDKTYCLQFVEKKYNKIYFFGDKTSLGGNDYEIFNNSRTESLTVKNPEETINYLKDMFEI